MKAVQPKPKIEKNCRFVVHVRRGGSFFRLKAAKNCYNVGTEMEK